MMMFRPMKNIDTAFRSMRLFCSLLLLACTLICLGVLSVQQSLLSKAQGTIYVLSDGMALRAKAESRADNLAVEARDHIRQFHLFFFTLPPDEKAIREQVNKALCLGDVSVKNAYDNLREQGYYNNLIAAAINQTLHVDSIQLRLDQKPYYFRCFATQILTRSSSETTRGLITEGWLRETARSDNNPHGFLIERWTTVDNKDIKTTRR